MSGIMIPLILSILTTGQFLSGLLFLVILLPITLLTIVTVISMAKSLFQQVQLRIDQRNITETRKFIGTHQRVDYRADVQLISNKKISCVLLKATAETFVLSATTPEELEWLTQLLSQWLQLPIEYREEPES